MTKKHDFAVYIGRFQPLHVGHEAIMRKALEQAETLIVLVGSANIASDMRNPFTFEERCKHISDVFPYEASTGRLIIRPVNDVFYNDVAWNANVRETVIETILEAGNPTGVRLNGTRDFRVALAGFAKDDTSGYLNQFKDWQSIRIDTQYGMFNACDIREAYFNRLPSIPETALSSVMQKNLREYMLTDAFRRLVVEHEEILHVASRYGKGPFNTADALVTKGDEVLLIKRGGRYGNGLWALPGGMMEAGETFETCMLRELNEETGIVDLNPGLTEQKLKNLIRGKRLYDDPKRDLRGHYISQVFLVELPCDAETPQVKGKDDAAHAEFVPIGSIKPNEFFADHYGILQNALNEAF